MFRRHIPAVIALLCIAGFALSLVSLQRHYASSESSYCDFGANFNCDIVNRSIYSEIAGVPVALIGVMGYSGLLILAISLRSKKQQPVFLLAANASGLAFALYLTYIEGFVLGVWCVLCLSSLALILVIAVLSALQMWYPKARN